MARQLLALPDEKLNIGEAALRLGALVDPDTDVAEGQRLIGLLAAQVRGLVSTRSDPDYQIRAINQALFKASRLAYDKQDPLGTRLDSSSLWRLLTTRKGNCVSLPVLWYAVAEQLGYPVSMVEAPQHFFLRYEAAGFRSNIEATSGGGEVSDERLIRELEVAPEALKTGAMLRSLSKRELLGALIAETAARLLGEWNVGSAAQFSEMALTIHPRGIAAHWNLAIAYNYRASMRASVRGSGEKLQSGGNTSAQKDVRSALTHAEEATRLGAPPPLAKDYWTRVSRLDGTEVGGTKSAPKPFDVSSLLQPGGHPIQFVVDVPPTLFQRTRRDPGSCLQVCSDLCGPGPGNRCAGFKSFDSRAAE